MGNIGKSRFQSLELLHHRNPTSVTNFCHPHTNVSLPCVKPVGHMLIRPNIFHFTVIRSPERLAKIAMADYISSHPGGVLGKVFN